MLRLFRRDRARFSADRVHERVVVEGGPVGRLAGELLHDTMPTLDDALAKMNRYSSESAAQRAAAGQRGGLGAAIGHAAWAFLRGYVVRRGFLDGAAGLRPGRLRRRGHLLAIPENRGARTAIANQELIRAFYQ